MEMESGSQVDQHKQPEAEVKTSEGRRKLIRGALVGVPVLLALKSTPVLACNCKLPSGFSVSGNVSQRNGAGCNAPANGPSYWLSNISSNGKFRGTDATGMPKVPKDTLFKNIFGGVDIGTLEAVLRARGEASYFVASYLNYRAGFSITDTGMKLTDTAIIAMYKGTFVVPNSNPIVIWDQGKGAAYLKYTLNL